MKFVAAYTASSLLVILIAAGQTADHLSKNGHESSATDRNVAASNTYSDFLGNGAVEEVEEQLESELNLKRMLLYVTPLMAIFQKKKSETTGRLNNKRSAKALFYEGRKRGAGRRPPQMYNKYSEEMQPDRSGSYGGYSSSSSYGGGGSYGGSSYGCCDKKDDLLPILALLALSLLLLYLIAIATTTVAGRRRRRLATDPNNNDLLDEDIQSDIELMDAPTWISMVDELWNSGEDESSDACTLKALCRMNRLALDSPGTTGLAVSLSSVPLSYLLHHRHQKGFLNYLDASLMGRYGENCATIFSSCPRLN